MGEGEKKTKTINPEQNSPTLADKWKVSHRGSTTTGHARKLPLRTQQETGMPDKTGSGGIERKLYSGERSQNKDNAWLGRQVGRVSCLKRYEGAEKDKAIT